MSHVRTVLGDVDASELGVTYAHEHLVIDGGRPVEMSPDFLLADVDKLARELDDARAAGLRTAIDAMPADCGRNPSKLADLSLRTGVNIVAATGLHHERFYGPLHWSLKASVDELADLFAADITEGIDEHDYSGPVVRRTPVQAGIVPSLLPARSAPTGVNFVLRRLASSAVTPAKPGTAARVANVKRTGKPRRIQASFETGQSVYY